MPPTPESIRRAPQYSRLAFQENCRLATEDLKIALSQATNNYLAIVAILKFAEATENAYLEAQVNVVIPDGHPNSPACGHLKFPHSERGEMTG
jgi:hypothetical protein